MNTFEITIQPKAADNQWPIVVDQSRASDSLPVRKRGVFQLDETKLLEQPIPLDYGSLLGRAVFQEEIRDAFLQLLASTSDPLHILLSVEAKELKPLRWERLCAPFDGTWDFLSQNQRTPFSLYLPSPIDRRFPAIGRLDLRALVVAASPPGLEKYGLSHFDVEAALTSVRAALGKIPSDPLIPATLDALCERLTAEPYTLLHFVCHGKFNRKTGDTTLFLANAKNQVDLVQGKELVERIRRLNPTHGLPHFTFLGACDSALPEAEGGLGGLAQRLVQDLGMPAVLAMTDKITVVTAQALTAPFYRQLYAHGEVDRALAEAMAGLANRYDITVPMIYSRLGGRPLFSDEADGRPLPPKAIERGLHLLENLLPTRAPILLPDFKNQATAWRRYVGGDERALSEAGKQELENARREVYQICTETLDLTFTALARSGLLQSYDDRCPFPGLAAFQTTEAAFFFGREALVKNLHSRLAEHNMLAVLGPSGSGKSSVVLAGLLPTLQAADPNLQLYYLKPGSDPVAQLASHHIDRTRPALVVVDQFEELFTHCPDGTARQTFIDRLLALLAPAQPANSTDPAWADSNRPVQLVLTLRVEFLGQCTVYPNLRTLIEKHQALIAPMTAPELYDAMQQQARTVALRFEGDLARTMFEDVAQEPGMMPLLQHALLRLWERRHGRWLLLQEYNAIGGVPGAIANTADGVYNALTAEQKRQMRQVFVRLTHLGDETAPGDQGLDTRQRVRFDELVPVGGDAAETRTLVAQLANQRLVMTTFNRVTQQEEVEVAHEALIRHWPKLREWLTEDRGDYQLRQRLNEAARLWQANAEGKDFLILRGEPLKRVGELARQPGFINSLEQSYVQACSDQQAEEQAHELALAQQTALTARRTTLAALISLIAFLLLVLAGWTELRAQNIANTRSVAESLRWVNFALQQIGVDPVASLELSLRALPSPDDLKPYAPQAELALTQALQTSLERRYLKVSSTALTNPAQVALGPQAIAVGGDALRLVPYDLDPNKVVTLTGPTEPIQAVQWYTDGETLLSREEHSLRVWQGQDELAHQPFPNGVGCTAWRPGREQLAVCTKEELRLWSYQEGTLLPVHDFPRAVEEAHWSPDGRWLVAWDSAALSVTQTLLTWDSLTARSAFTRSVLPANKIIALAWSPDSQYWVAILAGGLIQIQPVNEPQGGFAIDADPEEADIEMDGIAFIESSDKPLRFLTWGIGDVARLWSITGDQIGRFGEGENAAQDVQLLPDAKHLLTFSNQGEAWLWNLDTGDRVAEFRGHDRRVLTTADQDGYLATSSVDGTARIWSTTRCTPSCEALITLRGHEAAGELQRSDVLGVHWLDKQHLLTWGRDGSLRHWQVLDEQGLPLCNGVGLDNYPNCYGFSRTFTTTVEPAPRLMDARWLDNATILATNNASTAWRFALTTGQTEQWQDPTGDFSTLLWSPDGQRLFTYVEDNDQVQEGRVWDFGGETPSATVSGVISNVFWLEVGLLVSQADSPARLVTPETGQTRMELQGLTTRITAAAVAKNGQLATAEETGAIRLWDPQSGQQQGAFDLDLPLEMQGAVHELHWAKDGNRLLAAGQHYVTLWNTETSTYTWRYTAAQSHVAFSPQEDLVAMTNDRDLVVVQATDPTPVWRNNDAHAQSIHGLRWITGRQWANQDRYGRFLGNLIRWSNGEAWRGDDTRLLLLTWSGDGTARLWDWEARAEIMRLPDGQPIDFAALSGDGLHLLTAGDSGVVRVWSVWPQQPEGMVARAQGYRTRPLTEQQLQAFGLGD